MWIGLVIVVAIAAVCETNASILHAVPPQPNPHRKQQILVAARGGSFEQPSGQKLRQYTETDRMPSLFAEDEETYDRYAACLAATEGLRRLRDRDMTEEVQGLQDAQEVAKKRKQIATQYVQNSGKVLRALGMSVGKFNELGKEISKDAKLKEKVGHPNADSPWCFVLVAVQNFASELIFSSPENFIAKIGRLLNKRICTEWQRQSTLIGLLCPKRAWALRLARANICPAFRGIKSKCFAKV